MSKNYAHVKTVMPRHLHAIACGVLFSLFANENVTAEQSDLLAYDFNSSFLIGQAKEMDVGRFKYGNPILAGEYHLDTYVNEQWYGKKIYQFKQQREAATLSGSEDSMSNNASTCFTAKTLLEFGVKAEALKNNNIDDQACLPLSQWIEHAKYEFNQENQRIDISIPQLALKNNARGQVDAQLWDRGINAGYLSYNANVFENKYSNSNRDTISDSNDRRRNAYASINAGLNLAGWQFRHNGQWRWDEQNQSTTDPLNLNAKSGAKSKYESTNTYVQRAFPSIQSVVTLGENYSNGEVFDSFSYRGIDLSSDDQMLPTSQTGFAPRVRGMAKTNAKVEVRQQGQLIYQSTVAAGPFEINDLNPTGYGGELEVSVIEADGEVQTMRIPYASVTQLLRPGMQRYSATVGQFKESNIDLTPWVAQAKYQRGLNNTMTALGGIQASENYRAANLGAAFSTAAGAIALDATLSQADFKAGSQNGQSYRLSYSKLFAPTSTNLTLAAYRYSTENFYRLRDATMIQDREQKGLNTYGIGQQKSEFQITLNQNLPEGWGNFYAVGAYSTYWDQQQNSKNYQIGYSNRYRNFNYGLSANTRTLQNRYGNGFNAADKGSKTETEYRLSVSFPLQFRKSRLNTQSTLTQDSLNVGLSGGVGERFNYGLNYANTKGNNNSLNMNTSYRTNFSTLSATSSFAKDYQQYGLGVQGNIVAHGKGVVFAPEQGQTMVLVYAPDAKGASVNNAVGLSVNRSGYAVVPYVTPYHMNDIRLDPKNMSYDVELVDNTQRTAPFAGAISQVNFMTKTGKALYIRSKQANGEALPFAAEIYNPAGENLGRVAQGSLAYIRTEQQKGSAIVKWGDQAEQQCQIDYDLSENMKSPNSGILMMDGVCL